MIHSAQSPCQLFLAAPRASSFRVRACRKRSTAGVAGVMQEIEQTYRPKI